MTDLFEGNPSDPIGGYHEMLVGEGKKFKDDEALAKSKLMSDQHITKLETELADIRKELQKRMTLEEVVDKIKTSRVDNNEDSHQEPILNQTPSNAGQVSKEEILNLVKQTINQNRSEEQAVRNIDTVRAELLRLYGQEYKLRLQQAATELDVSSDFLNSMAATNPKAFIKVVQGAVPIKQGDLNIAAPPRSQVNTSAQIIQGKTYQDFEEMRKKDKAKYWSREVQAEMHRLALENPENFFR